MLKLLFLCLMHLDSVRADDDDEYIISAKIRDQVKFELSLNGHGGKFVTIGLFTDIVPKTVKNFIRLAESNHFPSYKNTIVHRLSSYMIQFGDVEYKNGDGGISSFKDKYFEDENFEILHYRRGYVAMSNNGEPDTNASQFYITTKRTSWLDGEFVVFGKVIEGWDVLRSFLQERVDEDEKPLREIKIIGANHKKLTRPTLVHFPSDMEASYEEDVPEEKDPNLRTVGDEL